MSIKSLIFDIETIPNPEIIQFLPPIEADSRLKDPAKIEASIKEKSEKRMDELGLDKTTCLICCISTLDVSADFIQSFMLNPESTNESELLQAFWDHVFDYDRFITFNGNSFDVPVLIFRSMIRSIIPTVKIDTRKYQIGNHVDVRSILGNWDSYAKGSLDYYSNIILGEPAKEEGIDGSMVSHMWDCGAYDEVREYCENDCVILGKIFKRLVGYYV